MTEELIQIAAALAGSLGFGLIFGLSGKKLYAAAIGGGLCWVSYLLFDHYLANDYEAAFFASALVLVYAEILARVLKAPVTVFSMIGTSPIIPGAALYRTMDALIQNDYVKFGTEGKYALLFAISMAAGIVIASVIFKLFEKSSPRNGRVM